MKSNIYPGIITSESNDCCYLQVTSLMHCINAFFLYCFGQSWTGTRNTSYITIKSDASGEGITCSPWISMQFQWLENVPLFKQSRSLFTDLGWYSTIYLNPSKGGLKGPKQVFIFYWTEPLLHGTLLFVKTHYSRYMCYVYNHLHALWN